MKNRTQRRGLHINKLRTQRTNSPKSKGVNTENVITSAVGKTGKKIHKRVNIDGGNFFIELKTTKE